MADHYQPAFMLGIDCNDLMLSEDLYYTRTGTPSDLHITKILDIFSGITASYKDVFTMHLPLYSDKNLKLKRDRC
jgi:hypothetical protein